MHHIRDFYGWLNSDSKSSIVFILAVSTAILVIRKSDSLLNPQFWAEDGPIFFLQQYQDGPAALFNDYAGYFHFVPRLVAMFADMFFPARDIPAVYNYSSLVITLCVIFSIYSPRLRLNNKWLLALAIVMVPHYTGEVFLNITNLQWLLLLLLIITLFKEVPNEQYGNYYLQLVSDFLIVTLCGLTGPFIVILMPLYAWKWLKNRNSYNVAVLLVAVTVSIIQIILMVDYRLERIDELGIDIDSLFDLIAYQFYGHLFFMNVSYELVNRYLLLVIFAGLVGMILSFTYGGRQFQYVVMLLLITGALLLGTFGSYPEGADFIGLIGMGQRYLYIPHLLFVWAIIMCLGQREYWKNILLVVLLIVISVSSLASGFRSQPLLDYEWERYSKEIGERDLNIPVNPPGWGIDIKESLRETTSS